MERTQIYGDCVRLTIELHYRLDEEDEDADVKAVCDKIRDDIDNQWDGMTFEEQGLLAELSDRLHQVSSDKFDAVAQRWLKR